MGKQNLNMQAYWSNRKLCPALHQGHVSIQSFGGNPAFPRGVLESV